MAAILKSLPFLTLLTHLLSPMVLAFCSACYGFTGSRAGLFAEGTMAIALSAWWQELTLHIFPTRWIGIWQMQLNLQYCYIVRSNTVFLQLKFWTMFVLKEHTRRFTDLELHCFYCVYSVWNYFFDSMAKGLVDEKIQAYFYLPFCDICFSTFH